MSVDVVLCRMDVAKRAPPEGDPGRQILFRAIESPVRGFVSNSCFSVLSPEFREYFPIFFEFSNNINPDLSQGMDAHDRRLSLISSHL